MTNQSSRKIAENRFLANTRETSHFLAIRIISVTTLLLLLSFGLALPSFSSSDAPQLTAVQKLIAAGQCNKAITELDRVLAGRPDDALAHYYRGEALEKSGSIKAASLEYETALLLAPSAKFGATCRMKLARSASSTVPTTSTDQAKTVSSKATKSFQLHGEQSRVIGEISDGYRKQLRGEFVKIQGLASIDPESTKAIRNYAKPTDPLSDSTVIAKLATSLNLPAAKLSREEKDLLASCDVYFLVDQSGSMRETDCPQGSTRWNWIAAQATTITRDAKDCFPRGLRLVVFDHAICEYPKVSPEEFVRLFTIHGPCGGTETGEAFRSQLPAIRDSVLQHHPVLILCITDGLPNKPQDLTDAFTDLKNIAQYSDTPVKVSLMQIGLSTEGLETLRKLESISLKTGSYPGITTGVSKGSRRNRFVQVYSFSELVRDGLPRTLVNIWKN